MIDFRPFINKLPPQILFCLARNIAFAVKRMGKQTHGDYVKWSKIVDFSP